MLEEKIRYSCDLSGVEHVDVRMRYKLFVLFQDVKTIIKIYFLEKRGKE